jgi:predicted RND superfamily exporter protein
VRVPSAGERALGRVIAGIERSVVGRPMTVLMIAALVTAAALGLGARTGRQYYVYDDLRPESQLARELRYVESVHGGSAPLVVYVEPLERRADAMLEPQAIALVDRITQLLESQHGDDVKAASSLSKYLRKTHRLLFPDAAAPLPASRPLVAQELLFLDDPRVARDFLSFDRGAATVLATLPDRGSRHATELLRRLDGELADATRGLPYRVTLTGAYGIADGVYRSLVGGLVQSLLAAIAISFAIFFGVLRSWRLALVALVPNVLPLFVTLGFMGLMRIDIKPSTVIVFSVTLVIADDDTIQYLSRFRARCAALVRAGAGDAHRQAALETLRECGLPMVVTALAVSLGFLILVFSQFLGLANFGILVGVSLLTAVVADLFLSPLLLMLLRPKIS